MIHCPRRQDKLHSQLGLGLELGSELDDENILLSRISSLSSLTNWSSIYTVQPELTLLVEPASDGARDTVRGSMGGGDIVELAARVKSRVEGNKAPR